MWTDYKFEEPENQCKCILPMNDISATIFYNQRFIISAPIPEPLAWRLTKQEDISPKGVRRLTFAQDKYDQYNDYIEKDNNGRVIGMYADYFNNHNDVIDHTDEGLEPIESIEPVKPIDPTDPTEPVEPVITSSLKCSGKKQIKVGGSFKTITLTFYKDDIEYQDMIDSSFSFVIDDEDVADLIEVMNVSENIIKIRFLGNDDYLGKILTVGNVANIDNVDVTSTLDIEIIPL